MKKILICLAALAWAVTGAFSSTPWAIQSTGNGIVESGPHLQPTQSNTNELRIAVTPPGCDDIGSVLKSMGWKYAEIQVSKLSDYNYLSQFDVIFINCSNTAYEVTDGVVGSLGNFLTGGGTLYASDLAYGYIQKTFSASYISFFDPPQSGAPGSVNAKIVDPGLASFLNSPTIEIQFNAPSWAPVQSVPDAAIVYLAGDFKLLDGSRFTNRPLAVSFAYGEGSVVYTAYHNEGQATEQEMKLINYLVFVTATRKLSAALQDSILVTSSGLFAQQELLGSINAGATTPRHTFSNPANTDLVVGLNWQEGTLKLSVVKPDGSLSTQQEGPPPLVIVIPNAEAGDWSYQVDAIDVPHDDSPYVVQINVPAVVPSTQAATLENPAGSVQATPATAVNDNAQGSKSPVLYIVVGGVLCLALLFAVVLIGVVIIVKKRRSA
jgi:hypothetical protein